MNESVKGALGRVILGAIILVYIVGFVQSSGLSKLLVYTSSSYIITQLWVIFFELF